MKAPGRIQFKAAIPLDIPDHTNNGNWEIVPDSQIPSNTPGAMHNIVFEEKEMYHYKVSINMKGLSYN